MRWFVEITPLGHGSAPSAAMCVDAPQWQKALQQARAARGDAGPLSNFSIELLEDGYRAIDPASRVRFLIRRAPDDAPLTVVGATVEPAAPVAPAAPASAAASMRRSSTLLFGSDGMAAVAAMPPPPAAAPVAAPAPVVVAAPAPVVVAAPAPVVATAPEVVAAPVAAPVAMPAAELISKREEDPSERSPLTYREYVYAVSKDTPDDVVTRFLVDRFEAARAALTDAAAGKFINLAIFDHVFVGKPLRRPLATLTWKDWKGDEPEIRYPAFEATVVPPSVEAPTRASAPPPVSSFHAATPPPMAPVQIIAPAPPAAVAPAPSKPPSRPPEAPPPRLSGEDLLSELFDACGDLQFLRDPLEGADFILALTLEKIPSDVGLVSIFDINKREYVVVRQTGGLASVVASRALERDLLAHAAMRSGRAVVVSDADGDPRVAVGRWKALGLAVKSAICAPVQIEGRTLGLIEIANPSDGGLYTEADGNALTYIGEQFAEFVSDRDLAIDPARLGEGAFKGQRL